MKSKYSEWSHDFRRFKTFFPYQIVCTANIFGAKPKKKNEFCLKWQQDWKKQKKKQRNIVFFLLLLNGDVFYWKLPVFFPHPRTTISFIRFISICLWTLLTIYSECREKQHNGTVAATTNTFGWIPDVCSHFFVGSYFFLGLNAKVLYLPLHTYLTWNEIMMWPKPMILSFLVCVSLCLSYFALFYKYGSLT